MSILGKVLLVFNLLLIGGFCYLAVQDYQGRQTITASALRHAILLQGLPLGDRPGDPKSMPNDPDAEIPFRVELAGDIPTETVSPALLKAYFAAAAGGSPAEGPAQPIRVGTLNNKPVNVIAPPSLGGNQPVPNQLAEADRVRKQIQSEVDKADGDRAKSMVLGAWLILQPETIDERNEILQLISGNNRAELEKRLYGLFDQVINGPKAVDAESLKAMDDLKARRAKINELRAAGVKDEPERRSRLARLLVHLDPSAAWQKRVMMVIGLRQYVRTIADQTLLFRQMTARVRKEIADDQARFVTDYAQLRGIAIQRTQMVQEMGDSRKRVEEQAQKDRDFVKQREVELANLKDQLARMKQDVNDLLARQKITEQTLFGIQREVGLTLEAIYQLEAELRKTEFERYGKN